MTPPNEPLAVTIRDACRITSLGRTTLYREAKAGRLKLIRVAGRTLIAMSELRRLLGEAG